MKRLLSIVMLLAGLLAVSACTNWHDKDKIMERIEKKIVGKFKDEGGSESSALLIEKAFKKSKADTASIKNDMGKLEQQVYSTVMAEKFDVKKFEKAHADMGKTMGKKFSVYSKNIAEALRKMPAKDRRILAGIIKEFLCEHAHTDSQLCRVN